MHANNLHWALYGLVMAVAVAMGIILAEKMLNRVQAGPSS